jgi:hypothetical protein
LQNVYTISRTHLVLSTLVTPTSIAMSSTMAQSRRYRLSWTISPNSKLTNRSSGKYMVVACNMYTRYQELTLFCGSGVPLPSIATSSAMTQSRRYRPSWTVFPKSVWIHRSSGKYWVHGCKMYARKQELTLFCGFDVMPWPKIAIEVGESYGYPSKVEI